MRKLAYIRIFAFEKNTARQLEVMKFNKTFTDKLSAVNADRPSLIKLIKYIRAGDEVWINSIDRLSKSSIDLHNLIKKITGKGATAHFKTENLTFDGGENNRHKTLHLSTLGAFAQFERELIKQRQAEGIAKAKERGAYANVGRKGLSVETSNEIKAQRKKGVSATEIAVSVGVGRTSVYRVLRDV